MIWPYLAAMAAASMWWNWRSGGLMLICVLLTAWCASASIPFSVVWYSAIYTGIGALSFFFFDRLAGAALCLIGALYALQGIGILPEYPRQVIGEAVFSIGVIAGAFFGPSGGYASRADMPSDNSGNRSVFGGSDIMAKVAPKGVGHPDGR